MATRNKDQQKTSGDDEQAVAGLGEELSRLSQVRDLLFGEDIRRTDHEREALETRLLDRVNAVEQEAQKQLADQAQSAAKGLADLQSDLAAQVARLQEQLSQQKQELTELLEQAASDLEDRKADRAFIAEVLNEAAARLASGP